MFGRRKRSSSHHQVPLPTASSQSAQSAASHAFLKSQPSTSSLSSAAAAAALRNRTPTPTSVGNVETKRMVQRRASSQAQADPLAGRRSASVSGTLRRTSSSGSMTARSFRDPSPRRPSTSSGPINHSLVNAPPLPSVPTQYANGKLQNRRSMSMQPQMRTPPASPPRAMVRGVSADRGGREGGGSSVNFSRPISPPVIPVVHEKPPVSRNAPLGRAVPASAGFAQHSLSQGTEKSLNTKSRGYGAANAEGNYVIKSVGASAGTAAAAAKADSIQKDSPRAETTHARSERKDSEPLDTSTRDPRSDDNGPIAVTTPDIEEQPSRTFERWPSTVLEEKEPADEVSAPRVEEARNRSATASPTVDHAETVSTPQPSPKADKESTPQQSEHARQQSSPGRSAHFSKWLSVSAAGDQVHQPPPEISVTGEIGSEKPAWKLPISGQGGWSYWAAYDGSRPVPKKKSVRVSFDDAAEIVGVAASPPTSPEEYAPDSPVGNSKAHKNWFGVGKKKQPSDYATGDDDFDEVLKPRPVLPSFGSVRKKRDGTPIPPIPHFSDTESTSTSGDEAPDRGVAFSNDHALESMFSKVHHAELSQVHNLSSVEQTSVSGEPVSPQNPSSENKSNGTNLGGITENPPFTEAESEMAVPSIAVQPATPMLENDRPSFDQSRSNRSSLDQYQIPGGFPPSKSDRGLKSAAEGVKQPMASPIPNLDDVDTDGDSGDSIYSDAEEDLDGDGFGSINAIVDSRANSRSSVPLDTISESRDITPKPTTRTAAIDSQSQDITEAPEELRSITPTQQIVNRQMKESPTAAAFPESPSPPPPSKSQAGSSRGGAIQSETRQKRTVSVDAHGNPGIQDRRSQPVNGAAHGKTQTRPVSLGPAFQMKSPVAAFPNSLRRTASNGSDSSSSFKRVSPSPRSEGFRSMRRTMRAGAVPAGQAQSPTLRAGSPEDYRPMSSGSGTGKMRKTLRSPPDGGERTSFFSTNKKAPPRAKFTKPPSKSRSATRFANSDDEDGPHPRVFRSRFADSSDEEKGDGSNPVMRPVRGIPRRQGAHDGDSTDLEDSSEEDRHAQAQAPRQGRLVIPPRGDARPPRSRDHNAPNMSGMAAVARQRGMSQRELEAFLMQPKGGSKQGFLTRIGLKKPKNDHRGYKADVESASRRETPLERSRLEREQLREPYTRETSYTATVEAEPPSSPSGKLHKKNKRHTLGGDTWPLRPQDEPPASTPVPEQVQSAPSSPLRTEKPAPINGEPPATASRPLHAEPGLNDANSEITHLTDPDQPRATW
ncbi:uncharacterized protein N7477_007960 [Penicillium maclennaniae]|uniref:uncharacterized protein n=1 Tax=Penicillium maclennaniae TaxID=1343394 RepID=UPI002541DA98|nr:uncharacterized protein N7477_007960 [Penicillium maclennaniae]KAJ5665512.1 hypothetical protein N7477_007960 [Penicillium maclennaniae]